MEKDRWLIRIDAKGTTVTQMSVMGLTFDEIYTGILGVKCYTKTESNINDELFERMKTKWKDYLIREQTNSQYRIKIEKERLDTIKESLNPFLREDKLTRILTDKE